MGGSRKKEKSHYNLMRLMQYAMNGNLKVTGRKIMPLPDVYSGYSMRKYTINLNGESK